MTTNRSPSYQFNVKLVDAPLFGPIDPDHMDHPKAWHQAFAEADQIQSVEISDEALDWIADELELEAEGLAYDAWRYVEGKYRPKAKGFTGGRVGEFGEALTYLIARATSLDIVRIVGLELNGGSFQKGHKYPTPDFFVRDGKTSYVLEVKSTEALNFQELDRVTSWKFLQPCHPVIGCRLEALPQLAYEAGQATTPAHFLKSKVPSGGMQSMPFPTGKGVAMSVMVVDGRTRHLRADSRFRTPPACRQATPVRNCWACLQSDCHVVITRMGNEPGRLKLIGDGGEPQLEWFNAYSRWSKALASHDARAADASLDALVAVLNAWRDRLDHQQQRELSIFWPGYLHGAMLARGFEPRPIRLALDEAFGDLDLRAPEPAEPRAQAVSLEKLREMLASAIDSPLRSVFLYSAESAANDEASRTTWSIRAVPGLIKVAFTSATWWRQEQVEGQGHATRIAHEVVNMCLRALKFPRVDLGSAVVDPVIAKVGGATVTLGWTWRAFQPPLEDIDFWFLLHARRSASWQPPKIKVAVYPDGRATLSMNWL
jgi:hypothetical protein